jgi:mannonate dehydratase
MKRLHALRFDGFLMDDHVPHMPGDTRWCHRGRAYATGYIRGLVKATAPA